MRQQEPAATTRALELRTRRGVVYPPTTLTVEPGSVTALLGPARSGRTALLLTLAGRMRPTAGTARVCGRDLVRERRLVRASVGLGLVAGVNDLDDALSPADHVAERRLLGGWRRRRQVRDVLLRCDLGSVAHARVGDLDTLSRTKLGIALALVDAPALIAIDDLDHDLDLAEQAELAHLLRTIAKDGTTVLFTCVDERTAALADAVVRLRQPAPHEEVTADAVA